MSKKSSHAKPVYRRQGTKPQSNGFLCACLPQAGLSYFARVKKDLREAPLTQFFISGSSCNFVPPFTKNKKRYALPIYLRICI
jgi:hypothetical protein